MSRLLVILLCATCLAAASQDVIQMPAADIRNGTSPNLNVVTTIKDAIMNELNHAHYPYAIAAAALVFGAFMWVDGGKSLELIVTISIAVVVGIIAKQSVLSYWETHGSQSKLSPHVAANVVGIEAGLITAAAVIKARKGVMVGVGAAAGFCVASFLSSLLIQHASPKFAMAEVTTGLHTLVCFPFAYAVYAEKHLGMLAFVAPFVGGLFISSALMYFLTEAIVHSGCDFERTTCNPPHPQQGSWVQFFTMAFQNIVSQPGDVDVGPLHNAGMDIDMKKASGSGVIFADHLALLLLWLLLWVGGCKFQLGMLKRRADKAAVKAREMLSEALLARL